MFLSDVGDVAVSMLKDGHEPFDNRVGCRQAAFRREVLRAWRGAVDDWFRQRRR